MILDIVGGGVQLRRAQLAFFAGLRRASAQVRHSRRACCWPTLCVAGAAALRFAIEDDLGCRAAEAKSAIIASSDSLLGKLRVAFGRFGGRATRSAPNLGVDFSPGRRRARRTSTATLRLRQDKSLKRVGRLRSLKEGGYDMQAMHVARLQQSAGASRSLTLALQGGPLWRSAFGLVLTWSTLVWKAATDVAFQKIIDVPRLGGLAAPGIQHLLRNWGKSRAPSGPPACPWLA